MPIAREGLREILIATAALGALAVGLCYVSWVCVVPCAIVWLAVLAFFRDPRRRGSFAAGDHCSPADGTVTEVTELDRHELIDGPAIRIGIFLSLFDVHINRAPCAGTVRALAYNAGEFLDARHPESGARNESNSILIDPQPPMPGPVEVRQVAGLVARRIVCGATAGEHLSIGQRFGMIKFGSRTELIIPRLSGTEISVKVGQKVKAGVTVLARQPVCETGNSDVCEKPVAGNVDEPISSLPN